MSAVRAVSSTLPPALVADLEEFEDWLVGCNYADTTIITRMFTINSAMKVWQTWDVRPSTVAGWLRAHSGWTASTYYTHLRCAFAWAQETGRIEVSPMAKLRSPASPDPTPRPLPLAVMQEALATAHGNLRAWLLLAYLAGLRSHEVAKFRGQDISPDHSLATTEHYLGVATDDRRDAIRGLSIA